MAYDRRRAALIACCVLAVVVAGSLFPAAGYGDYPASEAVDSGFYDGVDGPSVDGSGDVEDEPEDVPDENESDPEPRDENESEDEPDEDEPDEADEDEEEAENESDDYGSTGSDDSSPPVLALLFVGGFVAVGAIFWRVTDPTRSPDISADDLPSGFIPRLRLRLGRIPQLTMAATIGVSRTVPTILDSVAGTARNVGSGLGLIVRDLGRGVGTAMITIPSLFVRPRSPSGGLFSLASGVSSLFSSARSRSLSRPWSSRSSSKTRATSARGEPEPEPDLGPKTIEEAWEAMVEDLPVRRRRAKTPGEYARRAVTVGLPERAVSELTDAFRDVRYGGFPPSPKRTRRAREAFEEIRRTRDGDGRDDTRTDDRDGDGGRRS